MSESVAASELVTKLLSSITEDLCGDGPRHEIIDEDFPKNLYPAGNLGPSTNALDQLEDFRITEYVPSGIGLLFRLLPGTSSALRISGSFNIFYARCPTLTQLRSQAAKYEIGFPQSEEMWRKIDPVQIGQFHSSRIKYRPIFVRRKVHFEVAVSSNELKVDGQYHQITTEPDIQKMLDSISTEATNDPACLRVKAKTGKYPRVLLGEDLTDQSHLASALSQFTNFSKPVWKALLQYRAWIDREENCLVVEVLLSNGTSYQELGDISEIGQEGHLFNPVLELVTKKEVLRPFILSALRSKNYRIDSNVLSVGINCDTRVVRKEDEDFTTTDILPIYIQKRIVPAIMHDFPRTDITPSDLDKDPKRNLEIVVDYLRKYSDWWHRDAYDELLSAGKIPIGVKDDFLRAADLFDNEVRQFQESVQEIVSNVFALTAFRLMNRSFAINPRSSVKTWRLFQLVFITISLANVVKRAHGLANNQRIPPLVLWYPTGGGKTEAYLGLSISAAFFGRLRRKSFGITSWTKFPLRLLSIQQLSRIQAAVAFADIVRQTAREIPGNLKGDAFSVGLYAGGNNSTNDLDFPTDASRETQKSFEAKEMDNPITKGRTLRKNHKVDLCPMCVYRGHNNFGQIQTTYDPVKPGFLHECKQCGYRLELHVSDTETIRFLPTIVVSTIDKMAELGNDNSTKVLFGYAKSRCERHGYFLQEGTNCNVLGCGLPLQSVKDSSDPGPEILVQDEMHFLRENVGAFDSHYETMMLAILDTAAEEMRGRHNGRWNIIGSSATIEGYAEQVHELYCYSECQRFPVLGPARGMDAYASESKETQRFILGFRPQNMSHVDAVMKVLLSFHKVTLRLANPNDSLWEELGGALASLSREQRKSLMHFYRTSLAYCLLKTEAGQIHKSFTGQLNPILQREHCPLFEDHRIPNLTGELDATAIADVLHLLEKESNDWIQAVTATSLISHGVDLDVLNFIVFRGQPHTVSEWIQAMSRVGRRAGYPSIVVDVYNPNRERDAAYFTHHKKYIEHADSLIRSVPITRYSVQALRKTIRGLFYNAISYYADPNLRYYYRDVLKVELPRILDSVKQRLRKYYSLEVTGLSSKESRLLEALEYEIEAIIAILNDPAQPNETKKAIRPMTSLRDVDDSISITPSYNADFFSRG